MSEPVGNSPRQPLEGSNSHKARAAASPSAPPAEVREPIEAIVTGRVTRRKPNPFKRAARSMVADDVTNVGDFIVTDVLLPALRNTLYDIISKGSHRVLYGTDVRGQRRSSGGSPTSLKTAYHRASMEGDERRPVSRESAARHDFDDLILDTRSEAENVIMNLQVRVETYGRASVADLYDFLGVSGSFTDQRWGWTNLDNAGVRDERRGYVLSLPRPTPLK